VLLIVRHRSGSRATEEDRVALTAHREVVVGRAGSAAIRFDPRTEVSVGRYHARIERDAGQPGRLRLVDLGSRNGTYLNGTRIRAAELRAGDIVRLGARGPELEVLFEELET